MAGKAMELGKIYWELVEKEALVRIHILNKRVEVNLGQTTIDFKSYSRKESCTSSNLI